MTTLSEIENYWDIHLVDEPEIVIDSVYPRDEMRPFSTARVAGMLGRTLAGNRGNADSGIEATLEFMDELGLEDVALSPVQHVTRREIVEIALSSARRDERLDSESSMATRGFLATMPSLYGETVLVRGWIAGSVVRHEGDVFELTGSRCPRCFVNPQAYGHGGGVRCLDVRNCGYWYCA